MSSNPQTLVPPSPDLLKTRRRRFHRYVIRKHTKQVRLQETRSHRRFWISLGSVVLTTLVLLLSLTGASGVAGYQFFSKTQAQYQQQIYTLRDFLPKDNLKLYDTKDVLIYQNLQGGMHNTVKLENVSAHLQHATVATEDKDFWTNQGVDIMRILRAALDDFTHGHVVAGGSTITQQLIKNIIVGNQTTIVRKLEEIVLTPQLNSHYSKHDILEMYLNGIYYGHQAYGIDAAATIYFNLKDTPDKSAASQLDLAQSAMIAGIPSSPSAYDPLLHPKAAFNRFQTVLSLMMTQGYITKVEALEAIKEAQSPDFLKPRSHNVDRAPHFSHFVEQQLEQTFKLTPDQLPRSGLNVHTTLDIELQDKIQKIAQDNIASLRDEHHLTNAAEVLIDYHTGAVKSLLGSIDYNNTSIGGQYDVATQAFRQPGSSFKPYVYATAFEQGASPAQAIADEPIAIPMPGEDPPFYSPNNYDLKFHGPMTLRCALQNSLNVPAVKVLQHAGIDQSLKTAKDMGITKYEGTPGYSLVLGGLGVRMIDHVSAFGTFGNGGVHVPYYTFDKVYVNGNDKLIYNHGKVKGTRAISSQVAYMMTNVLSDNKDRLPEFGDCNPLQLYSNSLNDCQSGDRGEIRPAAAKTGTTNDFKDNWTVGYTTDYVMGVWAGNNDDTAMNDVTGIQGAAPIWHDSMVLAEKNRPIHDFTNPGGLIQTSATYSDGVQSTDLFLPNHVPGGFAPSPNNNGLTMTNIALKPSPLPKSPTAAPFCPSYNFGGRGFADTW